MKNLKEYLPAAVAAALSAGRAIMGVYTDPAGDFSITTKDDDSPLTRADLAADRAIRTILVSTHIPVLSEEEAAQPYSLRKDYDLLWIVDPLDGTREFIKRNDEFTVNIALVQNGLPVMGVVVAPALKKLYYGVSGSGAYRVCAGEYEALEDLLSSDTSLQVSELPGEQIPLKGSAVRPRVVASRSHRNAETDAFIEIYKRKHPGCEIVSAGSSLKICLVAEGSALCYPRFGPTMEWDTAAADAVARAAGLKLCSVVHNDGAKDEKKFITGPALVYNKEDLRNPWFIVESDPGIGPEISR